jgi:hypothetical protein
MSRMQTRTVLFLIAASCGGGGGDGGDASGGAEVPDAGARDGSPPASVAHCDHVPVPPTSGGGSVEAGPLTAGAAEAPLILPVSTALGGYTSRASFAGNVGVMDDRDADLSGAFKPSIGSTALRGSRRSRSARRATRS